MLEKAKFLQVVAEPYFWEDAELNGVEDEDGQMPLRVGNKWLLTIELATGKIAGWPEGVKASVWYKVCDQGSYYLQDENGKQIAKWKSAYVPASLLNRSDAGEDYIDLQINRNGRINRWSQPGFSPSEWTIL